MASVDPEPPSAEPAPEKKRRRSTLAAMELLQSSPAAPAPPSDSKSPPDGPMQLQAIGKLQGLGSEALQALCQSFAQGLRKTKLKPEAFVAAWARENLPPEALADLLGPLLVQLAVVFAPALNIAKQGLIVRSASKARKLLDTCLPLPSPAPCSPIR